MMVGDPFHAKEVSEQSFAHLGQGRHSIALFGHSAHALA
jgi:hypothetical protein